MSEKWNSRKYVMAMIYTAIVVVMRFFNAIDNDNFANLLIAFFAIYCGSNVVSKFVQK